MAHLCSAGIVRKEILRNHGGDCRKADALSPLARITIWTARRKLSPAPAIVAGRCNDAATWATTKLAPSDFLTPAVIALTVLHFVSLYLVRKP